MNTQEAPIEFRDLALKGGMLRYDARRISAPGGGLVDPASNGLEAVAVGQGGRQAAWYVKGEFGEAVLRRYRRGGLMARLSADRYLWAGAERTRSFAEAELLRYMRQRGLAVPRPLAAAYWRRGLTYTAALLTERIPDARPLPQALDGRHADVALAIFAMHEAGVWHADLNAYNILLDAQGKVWLIDFDKSRRAVLSQERRRANLLRLRRSLVKLAGDSGLQWWNELNAAYDLLSRTRGPL
ncbi:3-deoxy-D-manno-octulosonic acid kinase [Parapusillimonas granuli]|uniref:3-deoxy-D-manno-octulosonic acid kinase n=1 Tax=Parapusillimonas granuli TaxID=380911 RepID=A0A853GAS2_9BURK|nr:3-deoxy-D-manno-octulosonic acid kinase [Parapusillimonas granuli]MBB5216882.1 3-deoxy-D-manno-octulosonic acid kinase [Parapusillimonas granuli]MEB2401527.1 3-deoxy-D-manno-octulosonic acid kinase [Alcaligenaceae bacterium]NYT51681.1 3-deoxy-D-manno-octulosonic acid kinase [Parapusillimonas granuli]